ncbi:hypothetical protein ACFQZC_33585 [Streptacidiphilus monticola]
MLTMLSWLIVLCAAASFAVTIGAVLAQGPPLNRYLTPRRSTGDAPAAPPA